MTYDAVTGAMGFEDALRDLKQGEWVRRRGWTQHLSLSMQGGKLIFRTGERTWAADLTDADIVGEDWEPAL